MVKDHLLLERKSSLTYGLVLGCAHGVATAGVFEMGLVLLNEIVFTYSVFVSLVYSLNRHCLLRGPLAVVAVSFNGGVWQLRLTSGERISVQLEFPLFVNRHLVVMNLGDLLLVMY
mgnify:FL=1